MDTENETAGIKKKNSYILTQTIRVFYA